MKRMIILAGVIIVLAITGTLIGKSLILNGTAETVVLPQSQEDQIKQAVVNANILNNSGGIGGANTVDNVSVNGITPFENDTWLVANVAQADTQEQQDNYLIMKKVDDRFVLAVAPGTDFVRTDLKRADIPDSVIEYLDGQGVLNNSESERAEEE